MTTIALLKRESSKRLFGVLKGCLLCKGILRDAHASGRVCAKCDSLFSFSGSRAKNLGAWVRAWLMQFLFCICIFIRHMVTQLKFIFSEFFLDNPFSFGYDFFIKCIFIFDR